MKNDAAVKYGDIIDMEYRGSKTHKRMPDPERAAQFAPFAALTGFDDQIEQAAEEYNSKGDR